MKPTPLSFFTATFFALLLISSCRESVPGTNPGTGREKYAFVADSLPDFELFCRPLEDTSKEIIWYELKALNHTNESRKILFYHCDINYGIRSTGGMIIPQTFQCNVNVPYFTIFPAHGTLKYRVKMDRPTVRDPKFYWRLVVVNPEGLEDRFTVLDTIHIETNY